MKKAKKLIILYVFMCVCLISTAVYAALKVELKVNMSAIEFNPGEELVITLSTNSISGTTKGIFAVDGYFKYDSNIFETLTVEDIAVDGNIAYNPETNKFAIDLNEEILDQKQLFEVTLKVKEGVTPGDYEEAISLEDIEMFTMDQGSCIASTKLGITVLGAQENNNVVENNTTENEVDNTNTSVENENTNVPTGDTNTNVSNEDTNTNVTEEDTNTNVPVDDENTNTNTENTNTENVENTNTENTNVENTENSNINTDSNNTNVGSTKDNTTSDKILPATGKGKIIVSTLIMLTVISYIFYAKYMRLRGIED